MDKTLFCHCGLPWGKIENGCLIIESRHHGEKHTNHISLDMLYRLLQASKTETEEMVKGKGFRRE